jgi:ABC-type branched-subunit amino acid transport system substrate-binding protein
VPMKRLAAPLVAICLVSSFVLVGIGNASARSNAHQRSSAQNASPITIGVLRDVSGLVAFSSKQAVDGLTTTAGKMNKGDFFWEQGVVKNKKHGILGRQIKFVYFDTQANPNLALLGAQKLASEHVAAIIGTTTSPDAIQAKVACKAAQIPCLFPSVSAAAIVQPPDNDFAFTMAPTFDTQAAQLAQALKVAGIKNIAIIQDDSGTAQTVAGSFVNAFKAADVPIVATETVPSGAQDVTGQLARLKAKDPQAVLDLVIPGTLNVLFVQQFKRFGIDAQLFGINTLVDPVLSRQMGGAALNKAVVIDQWNPKASKVKSFASYFRKVNGTSTPIISTHIYMAQALLTLKIAMEKARSTDGSKVKSALESLTRLPVGYGQNGNTLGWTAANHNGSDAGGIVFATYKGSTYDLVPWSKYQPKATKK